MTDEWIDEWTGECKELFMSLIRTDLVLNISSVILKGMDYSYDGIKYSIDNAIDKSKDNSLVVDALRRYAETILESTSKEKVLSMYLEMITCKNVEVFDYFISRMLKKVFIGFPGILSSSDSSISMSEILQCESINDILLRVAEKKVQSLGYKGLMDIMKYLNSQLKLDFDIKLPELLEACEIFQTRNIIVHNSGIINEIYIKNVIGTNLKVGYKYPLTEEYVRRSGEVFRSLGTALDKQFRLKFNL